MSIVKPNTNLPTLEPQVYSGDPFRYREWIAEFQTIIEPYVKDSLCRLFYLKKYTTGLAREAIDGYLQISDASSYDRAQALLKTRFGDPSLIAGQYRRSLEFWESLDDENYSAEKLRKFSDFLDMCRMLKEGYLTDQLCYWDDPQFIRISILCKLPKSVAKTWHKKLCEEKTAINQTFSVLTDCVREMADQMCRPCYIYPGSPLYQSIQQQVDKSPKCKYCKCSSHKLQRCDKMQYLSVYEQRKFIQQSYHCMGRGHKSNTCTSPVKCIICHLKHPTCLHRWKNYNKNLPHDLETPNGHYDDFRKSTYESESAKSLPLLAHVTRGLRNR